jgi:hypothetical protein
MQITVLLKTEIFNISISSSSSSVLFVRRLTYLDSKLFLTAIFYDGTFNY